jgi:hypothetical protein
MAVFVNTLLEQREHHRSDTALSQLRAVMFYALLLPFLYLGEIYSTLNVITTALLPQTPSYPV